MQPRVTAILVARNGAGYLERTLKALKGQSRRPDSTIFVDDASTDASADLLTDAAPTTLVRAHGSLSFGASVNYGVDAAEQPRDGENEWLWLLAHDNAPDRSALSALLGAVEIAPSVAVAGPKLMRLGDPGIIEAYGETVTRFGSAIALVSGELDQAQHDSNSDLLAVAANGMLVRRSVWVELGGFDRSLPSVDAALDFCIRVRLAGHRIVGVPDAKVASAGGAELFGRTSVSGHARNTLHRRAQLHRRLVYAPLFAVPLHWLLLLPLAVVRSVGHLLGKHPGSIPGEFAAAIGAAFDAGVLPARRRLGKTRRLGWGAITPLRMPAAEVRELRAHQRALRAAPAAGVRRPDDRIRPSFLAAGGAWIVLFAAAIGAVVFSPLFGAAAVTGGALAPLSATVAELWTNVGYGWRDVGAGFVGAADPFAFLLAVLGSLTFWAPSQSIIGVYLLALPIAALGAWWCAARFAERGWAPAIAAILWCLAPPFLSALGGGHLGAVIAHMLLPWLVLATVNAARSWSAGAASALLFAATVAAAPVLAPALLLGWVAWMITHPRSIVRIAGIPIPAAALFAPLVAQQGLRGNWFGLLADPGVPVVDGTASGWQLALGSPVNGYSGWSDIAAALALPELAGPIIVAALLTPLAALALLALFLPGSRRAMPAMLIALVGFVTAVGAAHLHVAAVGEATAAVWPGSGLSVYWLGLIGAVVVTLEALARAAVVPALLVAVASAALAGPLLAAPLVGGAAIRPATGQMLPAFVTAEATTDASLGTLELTAQPGGGVAAVVHRGAGTTLDARSTLAATALEPDQAQRRIATLAGNLVSQSGYDSAAELQKLQIGFVLAPDARGGPGADTRKRATEALDGNGQLTAIGDTDFGFLWRFGALTGGEPPTAPGPLGTPTGTAVLLGQAGVLVITLLLAIPTGARRPRSATSGPTAPASTFEEDDDA